MKTLKNFLGDESGATAIEYGLIAALISVAAVFVLRGVGQSINGTFTDIKTELDK